MLKLIIEDDEGRKTVVPFVRDEMTIGRQEGNTIRLTERNVSRHHARLVRQNGHVLLEDLGSYNGVRINGQKIQGQVTIRDGDLIQIGDYGLAIQSESGAQATPPPLAEESAAGPTPVSAEPPPLPAAAPSEAVATPVEPLPAAQFEAPAPIATPEAAPSAPATPERLLDPEQAPRLFVLNTEYAGREFACIRTLLLIGRTEDSDIAIDHPSLSRIHARLWNAPDGEWRIADLESVNGMAVNGERQTEASLHSGDELELGQVKFRFLGPQESAGFVSPVQQRRRKRRVALAGALVAFAVVGVWAYPRISRQSLKEEIATALPSAVPPASPAPPERSSPPPPASPPPAPVASAAPASSAAVESPAEPEKAPRADEDKLHKARAALEAHQLDAAAEILGSVPGPEAAELTHQLQGELSSRKRLMQAQKELALGRPERASELLATAQMTPSYTKEYAQLRTQVDAALGKDRRHAREVKEVALAKAPPERPPKGEVDSAHKQYEQGVALLRNNQLHEAQASFTHCLDVDPTYARCYMLLGSTLAKVGKKDEAAKYYRIFIRLAPSDPLAPRVREHLENYDGRQKTNSP